MSFPPALPSTPDRSYENRTTGLTVFGILTILMGCICALFVPLMLMGTSMAAKAGGPPPDSRALLPAVFMYGGLAIADIWLGIGSIKARRWARALLLIFSWSWLVTGVFATVFMAFAFPKIMAAANAAAPTGQPAGQADAIPVVMGITIAVMVMILVIVPAVWVYFYRSAHVKATCEAEDPVVRWTDRSPLPVIAVCLWMVFTAPMMLFMAVAHKGVIPFFGMFVVGPPATATYLLLAALWAYAAWAMYKLQPRGWWIITASIALFSVSAFLTYSQHDVSELYRLMEYPAAQIAQIEKFNFLSGTGMAWLTLSTTLPFLGYMLFLRRYFVQPAIFGESR